MKSEFGPDSGLLCDVAGGVNSSPAQCAHSVHLVKLTFHAEGSRFHFLKNPLSSISNKNYMRQKCFSLVRG